MSTTPGRPTVDDVALLIRARTKDRSGNEVGTFDDETRPTGTECEQFIDASMAVVGISIPPLDKLAPTILPGVAAVVALEAASRIEKAYWPEQVRSDRSPYAELRQEYRDALTELTGAIEDGGSGEETTSSGIVSLPVGSWTSIREPCIPPEPVA